MRNLQTQQKWLWPLAILAVWNATPAVAQEKKPADGSAQLAAIAKSSPAAATILEMPRENPVQAATAVLTLLDLREPIAAELVLKELTARDLSPVQLASIARGHGTARMLELAGTGGEDPLPGAREFAQRCLDAAADQAVDPEHLEDLIAELTADRAQQRSSARQELATSGAPAAAACFAKLAVAQEQETRVALLEALAEMHPVVDPLLIAVLADSQGQLRRDAAELAGHLHLVESAPWLATFAAEGTDDSNLLTTSQAALQKMGLPIPNAADAVALIHRELERLGRGIPVDANVAEDGLWWSYSPETREVTSHDLPEAVRRSLAHARLSYNLLLLPASPSDELLALVSNLETAHQLGEKPPGEFIGRLAKMDASGISSALRLALQTDRNGAALSCIELLSEQGLPAALDAAGGKPSPLVLATREPSEAVKFAALQAIMKLKPQASYAGASYVTEALWSLAARAGTSQAMVGAPSYSHASDWAGMLRSLGYDATPVATGIELVKTALKSPRLELILVDSDIGRPLVRETLYQIRRQPELAGVPVAILSANTDLDFSRERAELDHLMLAVSRPHSKEAMKSLVERLNELVDDLPNDQQRLAHAKQAIEWLGELLATGKPYTELVRNTELLEKTLYNPELSQVSLAALAQVGTAGSQQALLDFASQGTQPLELRQAAAKAFAQNFTRFRFLLTAEQIARQYDRYNASETADEATQKLLGSILDVLERKEAVDLSELPVP